MSHYCTCDEFKEVRTVGTPPHCMSCRRPIFNGRSSFRRVNLHRLKARPALECVLTVRDAQGRVVVNKTVVFINPQYKRKKG